MLRDVGLSIDYRELLRFGLSLSLLPCTAPKHAEMRVIRRRDVTERERERRVSLCD